MSNSRRLRIIHLVGARPNFMKAAPVLDALKQHPHVTTMLVHSGQHYDVAMSGRFFEELGLPSPDLDLGVGSASHAVQVAQVMTALEPLLQREHPDLLIVVGDVNSTLAGALTAAKLNIPVAHVEAGLRSGDRTMPEEINRLLTDQISDLLFTPSRDGNVNLAREGIPPNRVHLVGNGMIDTLLRNLARARALGAARQYGLNGGRYAVVTLHRPSNVDHADQLAEIYSALETLAAEMPVLFPVHPRTNKNAERFGLRLERTRTLPPLGYLELLDLMSGAALVLTDSGGVQEETTALGVPCLTLRQNTERPITIDEGTNTLVPVRTRAAILAAAAAAGQKQGRVPELWDGRAGERIADAILHWAGNGASTSTAGA
jgi:UDP-N-acetylglucosamine 2-epimerase (non-hydrolysing)